MSPQKESMDINETQKALNDLKEHVSLRIIGQERLIENMLVCLLCDGHMLIEGMPGLAKTTAAKALAGGIEGDFHRVQFTPDLLPSDLVGTDIYLQEKSKFEFRQGPLFHNIILADEINRAPAKVQSALLESMEEKQITVGMTTYKLPELFMVLATQNPVEQEGTYNLPEAQLDRFLMNAIVEYPTPEEELAILKLDQQLAKNKTEPAKKTVKIAQKTILEARKQVLDVYIDDRIKDYIVAIVNATRFPKEYSKDLHRWLRCGASPRASLALVKCSKALAWLNGDEYVSPHHVQKLANEILRHRIIPSFEAEAEAVSRSNIVKHLIEVVAVA
ncbi:MoxR family ATPase [Rickettsiales bacterium]|nr:MoxR family ATPase [Rickettsiales bacterium]